MQIKPLLLPKSAFGAEKKGSQVVSPQTEPTSLSTPKGSVVFPGYSSIRFGQEKSLKELFPKAGEIPANADFPAGTYPDGRKTLINGEIKTWQGATTPVTSPVLVRNGLGASAELTPKYIGELPDMTVAQATEALDAACNAYNKGDGEWPTMPLKKRIDCLENFIQAIKPQNSPDVRENIVKLLMLEICKTREDAEKEFDRTVEYMERTVEAAKALDASSKTIRRSSGKLMKQDLKPLGVTLCMGPANYPLNETFTTLIPALLMGNPIICKLPKIGALSNVPLFEAFQQSFPKGSINFISGDGPTLINPLMQSGKIDTLAFIGSTKVGNALVKQHPSPVRLNPVLGLGAKNPAFVLPDADLDKAVKEGIKGSLSYNGQRCTALKIFFVPRNLAESFSQKLAAEVNKLKLGMPYEKGIQITPVPSVDYYKGLVEDAVSKGARIINPGGGQTAGTLFKPAVLYPVTPAMTIYSEEQFGPVIPIVPYDTLDDALNYMKNSPYGQQASVFGKDPKQIQKAVDKLQNQVCRININEQCQRSPDEFPFGGRKDSAKGILSVEDALKIFSIPNLLTLPDTPENLDLLKQLTL